MSTNVESQEENHRTEARTGLPRTIDIQRVARDGQALLVLRTMVRVLRRRGWTEDVGPQRPRSAELHPLQRFARGDSVAPSTLAAELGDDAIKVLLTSGAAWIDDEGLLAPGLSLWFANGVAVVVPVAQQDDEDLVYIGAEAPWLIRVAWKVGRHGGAAADLATGTGVIATVLSARYSHVVAADASPAAVACAALTLGLNASPRSRTEARVADVATGLERGVFDLVVANPPWVPSYPGGISRSYLYADGGETGMELPARFVAESRELLRPGGVAIIALCDSVWSDGRRPLTPIVAGLRADGFEVEIEPAPSTLWTPEAERGLCTARPDCVAASLVALILRAPGSAES